MAFGWPTVKVGGCDGFEREREISEREFGRERDGEKIKEEREGLRILFGGERGI